jgi:NAD(P)-dependent dehydrogenase (short-subunit alcohol dehydrogenase family)
MDRLKGKRALITGGTSGIGLETARHFRDEGARIIITGLGNLEAARQELGPEVPAISSNAGELGAQAELAKAVEKEFGALDILVLNAGIVQLGPLEKWDEAGFDRTIDINFKGPFFLIQALLPLFASPASIVVNASINAHVGMPNSSVYAASKAAMLSLVKTLSGELISRGIRLNAVSPGPIDTPIYDRLGMAKNSKAALDFTQQIPARRFGNPAEIANAIVFLASDEAAFTVGSELVIDGGMSTL